MKLKVGGMRGKRRLSVPDAPQRVMAEGEQLLLEAEGSGGVPQRTAADAGAEFRRQVEAFLQIEPMHRRSYRELAK